MLQERRLQPLLQLLTLHRTLHLAPALALQGNPPQNPAHTLSRRFPCLPQHQPPWYVPLQAAVLRRLCPHSVPMQPSLNRPLPCLPPCLPTLHRRLVLHPLLLRASCQLYGLEVGLAPPSPSRPPRRVPARGQACRTCPPTPARARDAQHPACLGRRRRRQLCLRRPCRAPAWCGPLLRRAAFP